MQDSYDGKDKASRNRKWGVSAQLREYGYKDPRKVFSASDVAGNTGGL